MRQWLMQAHSFKMGKEIVLDLSCQAKFIANSKELRQIVLNLLNNALDASSFGGTVTIKTECKNNFATLSVSDKGTGIPNEVMKKLGTPFFTTKDTGTGLGLAVCYSIAERHNATIEVKTGPRGTTFFVHFPLEISQASISA